ncbi:MAG: small multi-drug export protein [Gammaproteobacteria bacterium]
MRQKLRKPPHIGIEKLAVKRRLASSAWWVEVAGFLFPILLTLAVLGLIGMIAGKAKALQLLSLAFATFFALGKLVVFIPLMPMAGSNFKITFTPWELATMVMYMDTMVAVMVMYSIRLLEKFYWIGPILKRIREDCFYLLQTDKRIKRISSVFIPLFVAFPIAGTGAVGGGIISGLLGFSRLYSIFLIWVGASLGAYGLAFGAVLLKVRLKEFIENPIVSYGGFAALVLIMAWFGWKLKRIIAQQKA